jgi:hypothetical protein
MDARPGNINVSAAVDVRAYRPNIAAAVACRSAGESSSSLRRAA